MRATTDLPATTSSDNQIQTANKPFGPLRCHGLARREVIALGVGGCALGALGPSMALGAAPSARSEERGLNPLSWLNRGRDSFETVYEASTGVVAARMTDFSLSTPTGMMCRARLAYPVTVFDRMPLIVFCPDQECSGAMYDAFIGGLAASGYFVMAVDPMLQQSNTTGRSGATTVADHATGQAGLAETQFLIDQIGEAAKVLGPRANRVDASRVGISGHGTGAWKALHLAGWGVEGGRADQGRDGRIMAAFALFPSTMPSAGRLRSGTGDQGTLALVAGAASGLPIGAPGSNLLTLALPVQTTHFGGLIGCPAPGGRSGKSQPREARPLAATIAAASIFFDWSLKRKGDRKRTLLELNGRVVEGLSQPLTLNRA